MYHMGSRNILSTRIPLVVKTQKSHHTNQCQRTVVVEFGGSMDGSYSDVACHQLKNSRSLFPCMHPEE